jgi:site-specific recombinase XerD
MNGEIVLVKSQQPDKVQFIDSGLLDHDYFIKNYKEFLVRDLADGHPSDDTKTTYFSNIDNFLRWCVEHKISPLSLQEYHLKVYREQLWKQGFRVATVALKLTTLRRFFQCALKLKLIEENPMMDIRPGKDPNAALPEIHYLTAGQLEYLIRIIPIKTVDGHYHEEYYRDRLMIVIMSLEGLRTVEVKRMNVEDIFWHNNTILIRGKGHNDLIYPREDTMTMLKHYLDNKSHPTIKDKNGTPVFTVISNNNQSCRMSRQAIRQAIDFWFEKAEIKKKGDNSGLSCHLLRHTCGTLLYAETKDLQVVKETLRHKDLKMSSKYAHLQDRNLNRYTRAIPVKINT